MTATDGLAWTLGPADYIPLDPGRGRIDYGLGLYAFATQTAGVVGLHLSDDGATWSCIGCNQGVTRNSYDLGAGFSETVGRRVSANFGFSGFEPRIQSTTNGTHWVPSLSLPSRIQDPSPSYYDLLPA